MGNKNNESYPQLACVAGLVVWNTVASTASIAEALGVTKNAVVGRLYRHDMGAGPNTHSAGRKVKGEPWKGPDRTKSPKPLTFAPKQRVRREEPPPSREPTCMWPMWPNGAAPTQEFCGRPSLCVELRPGVSMTSYCSEHLRAAYQWSSGVRNRPAPRFEETKK